jgi:predicted DCC family thiol-disulfide oxidoreductase YuxK
MTSANPIILYDGVCGLCNRFIQFVLHRDNDDDGKQAVFRFASLQSPLAATILKRHSVNSQKPETVYVVLNAVVLNASQSGQSSGQPEERLLPRSDAVIFVLKQLGGIWRIAGQILKMIPRPLRDWGYSIIASNRYRIFGRFDTCPIPAPKHRQRFIDF